MGADYYFRMGSTHSICQDYALAGESNGIPYAVLSDGCSGEPKPEQPGSPYTDFGARFLVTSTLRNIPELQNYPLTKIISEADAIRRQASLPSDSLDATLLAVTECNGEIPVIFTGDGVIVRRTRQGTIHYTGRKFDSGMPGYLNYTLKKTALPGYLEKVKKFEYIFGERKSADKEYTKRTDEHTIVNIEDSFGTYSYSKDECDLVILFSDGIESFVDSNNNPIPVEEVIDIILDMPQMKGQFLTRSCRWFLNTHCVQKGWKHIDDFSCAGIYIP